MWEETVTSWYWRYLKRAPDPGGLIFWCGVLTSGVPSQQALSQFLSSLEYVSRYGGNADALTVGLFLDALGREPSVLERVTWAAHFQGSFGYYQPVFYEFLTTYNVLEGSGMQLTAKHKSVFDTLVGVGVSVWQMVLWIVQYGPAVFTVVEMLIVHGLNGLTVQQITTWVEAAVVAFLNNAPLPPFPTPVKP